MSTANSSLTELLTIEGVGVRSRMTIAKHFEKGVKVWELKQNFLIKKKINTLNEIQGNRY